MTSTVPVGPGTRVTLKFSLKLPDGELIDSTGDRPASFIVGDGNLLPGFERVLQGLTAGASKKFEIPAESGFGAVNPDNVHMLKRTDFAPDMALTEGLVVSFADAEKLERPGVVVRLLGDLVEVDFNHPLAGKDLVFEVEVLAVEQVSADIIRM